MHESDAHTYLSSMFYKPEIKEQNPYLDQVLLSLDEKFRDNQNFFSIPPLSILDEEKLDQQALILCMDANESLQAYLHFCYLQKNFSEAVLMLNLELQTKHQISLWNFQEYQPRIEGSKIYDLGLPEFSDNLGIGFINGISNNFEGSYKNTKYISDLAEGYNVHAVYIASQGIVGDLFECAMALKGSLTYPVKLLHQMWDHFFKKASADAKFLMICHSQGVTHVRNALISYDSEWAKRLIVLAIAPGAYICEATDVQVIHYRASVWRDFIPYLDREGAYRMKNSIVTLNSHPFAPKFDHTLISKTYEQALKFNIMNYIFSEGQEISQFYYSSKQITIEKKFGSAKTIILSSIYDNCK